MQIEEDLARFKEMMEGNMGATAGNNQSATASAGR